MKYGRCITSLALLVLGCTKESAPEVQQSKLGFEEIAARIGLQVAFDETTDDGDRAAYLDALPAELRQISDAKGAFVAGDIDGDADIDLIVLTASGRARVFTNPLELGGASSQFVDVTEQAGLSLDNLANSPILADFVGDDKPDLLVVSYREGSVALYENRWPLGFVDVTASLGLQTSLSISGLAVADVDNDGDLDFFASEWRAVPLETASPATDSAGAVSASSNGALWLNDARKRFELRGDVLVPLSAELGVAALGRALSPSFADIDADGDMDLLLAGENRVSVWVNALHAPDPAAEASGPAQEAPALLGDAGAVSMDAGAAVAEPNVEPGTLHLVQVALSRDVSGRGTSLGDYDLDGDLDWFISGGFADAPKSSFLSNTGSPQQWGKQPRDNGTSARGFGLSSCLEDFDNDGLMDIFQVADANFAPGFDASGETRSVTGSSESRAALYLGRLDPAGSFADAASSFGLDAVKHGRGVLCFDYDRDGDVDLFVSADGVPLRVFSNTLNPGVGTGANALGLRLSYRSGNPAGIGSRVQAVTHGVTQVREVHHAGGTFGSGVSLVHIGFAAEELVDELTITWPNGESSTATDVFLSDELAIRYKGDE